MQRIPISILSNVQLPAALPGAAQYTTPGLGGQPTPGAYATVSAVTLNNTTAAPRTVTFHIVPFGQSPTSANQIGTTVSVPAAGSSPTVLSALIGHTLPAGWMLYIYADGAAAVTALITGYLTTL